LRFRRGRAALGLALTTMLAGCSLDFDATSLGVPVTMASPVAQPAAGDRFRVSSHALWAFWGMTKLKRPALNRALATQLAGGKGIADLKIKTHASFGDVLITVLTGGIFVPRSVIYEGVVVEGGAPK
jgi:Bor protein